MERKNASNRETLGPDLRTEAAAELEPGHPEAIRVKVLVVALGTVLALCSMLVASAFAPVAGEAAEPAAAASAPAEAGPSSAPLSSSTLETKATFTTAIPGR